MARIERLMAGGQNMVAFLDMLAVSEIGRALLAKSDDGYNVIVGSTQDAPILFQSYAKHPHQLVQVKQRNGKIIPSTAAGRYQILAKYGDHYIKQLGLRDFGPLAQDRIAIQLIKECKATDAIQRGEFVKAVFLCRSRWASLPGAGYDQHENDISKLAQAYAQAGGKMIAA